MTERRNLQRETAYLLRNLTSISLSIPKFADRFPDGALIVMQIEGDKEFNESSLLDRSTNLRFVESVDRSIRWNRRSTFTKRLWGNSR